MLSLLEKLHAQSIQAATLRFSICDLMYLLTAVGPAAAWEQFVGEGRYRQGWQVMEGLSGTAGRPQTGNLDPSEPRHSLDDQYIKQKTKKCSLLE